MNIVLTNLTDYAKNNLIGTWHLKCSKLLGLSCSSYKAFVKINLFCWIGEPELYFSIVLVRSKFHICSLLILCASSLFSVHPEILKCNDRARYQVSYMDNQDINDYSRSCLLTSCHSTGELNSKESFPSFFLFLYSIQHQNALFDLQKFLAHPSGSHIYGWYQNRIKYPSKNQGGCTACFFRAKHLMARQDP